MHHDVDYNPNHCHNFIRMQFSSVPASNSCLRLLPSNKNVDSQTSRQYHVIRTSRHWFFPWASPSIFRNVTARHQGVTQIAYTALTMSFAKVDIIPRMGWYESGFRIIVPIHSYVHSRALCSFCVFWRWHFQSSPHGNLTYAYSCRIA